MADKNPQYQGLFDKIYDWLRTASNADKSKVSQWVNKAEEFINAAEQLSVSEYQLSLTNFKQDLLAFYNQQKQDANNSLYLQSINEGMWQQLAHITDQTQIEWSELVDDFEHDGVYHSGDLIGFGRVSCEQCGHIIDITHASKLINCLECGSNKYNRQAFE